MSTKTVDCLKLQERHIKLDRKRIHEFEKKILNGRVFLIQYEAFQFLLEHKDLVEQEGKFDLCDKCWELLETMRDETGVIVEHLREHDLN